MSEKNYRIESDLLGELKVPADAYYGVQTQRALNNYKISNTRMCDYPEYVISIAYVKMAAAAANAELGVLDKTIANAIIAACCEIVDGKFHDQFPIDMMQSEVSPEMQPLKERIRPLVDLYEKAVNYVKEQGSQAVHDFLARRLYDMTCEIIMSLLIIDDAHRAPELFEKSANVYVRMTEEDVCAKAYYIMHFTEADLASFRAE
jgi:hypothetical protein